MSHIKEIVLDYVYGNHSNPSALMINGKWGSGKTYYLKEELTKAIRDHKKHVNEKEVVYISLNGLSRLSEINDQLVTYKMGALGKMKEHKIGKIGFGLLKSASRIGVNAFNFTVGETNVSPKTGELPSFNVVEFFNFEDKVICFDDLERVNPKLSIDEVLGFINRSFIEVDKPIKVIIIGDETQIYEKEKYQLIKEKVVGRTVYFETNLSQFINLQIKIQKGEYKDFLEDNQAFLVDRIIQSGEKNLRTILFMLDSLNRIVDVLDKNLKKHLAKSIILTTLSLAFEYKKGALEKYNSVEDFPTLLKLDNLRKWKELKIVDFQNTGSSLPNNDLEKVQDFSVTFDNLYIGDDSEYIFLPSVFNFIVKGYLDEAALTKELDALLPVKKSPHLVSLERLIRYCFSTNEEFLKDYSNVRKAIEDGSYDLLEYLQAAVTLFNLSHSELLHAETHESIETFLCAKMEKISNEILITNNEAEDFAYKRNNLEFQLKDRKQFMETYNKLRKELTKKKEENRVEKYYQLLANNEIEKITSQNLIDIILLYPDDSMLIKAFSSYVEISSTKLNDLLNLILSMDSLISGTKEAAFKLKMQKIKEEILSIAGKIDIKGKPITRLKYSDLANRFDYN